MKEKQKTKQGIPRLLELSGEKGGSMIASNLLSIAGTLCQLIPFWSIYKVMAELLNHVAVNKQPEVNMMIKWAFYGLIAMLVGYLLAYVGGMRSHTFAYRVICKVRLKVAEHIGKLPMGYVSNNSVGKIKQVLDDDVEQIETFLAHQLPDFVSTLAMLLVLFVIMFSMNIWLALSCFIPIVIGFVCQFAVMVKILKSGGLKENFDALERISASSTQYVKGMPAIKIFGQTVKSFRMFYDDIIRYRDFTTRMTEVIRPGYVRFRMFVLSVATFIVPVGLVVFLQRPTDVSFVVTFLFFLILGPGAAAPTLKLRSFSESMNVITEGVNRLDGVLNETIMPEPNHSKRPESYDVEFQNVEFFYTDKGENVLKQVSFAAKQDEITALVGPSGAGKSTIAELIPRFWDVTGGSITIGGVDVKDIAINDLMACMAFVFQESFLFSDTIYNNIALGRPGATKDEVENAARAAQCHNFIINLPQGYQTKIGDLGTFLSGGEQQRISVARAILKNAPILILDEASAYADAENEHEMQLAISELIKSKTVIMIAHRLATINHANQILVVDKGTIIERGVHDELLQNGGLYSAMWKAGVASSSWIITTGEEELA